MKRLLRLFLFWIWCLHPPLNVRVFYRCVASSKEFHQANPIYGTRLIRIGYVGCTALERAFIDWRYPQVRELLAQKDLLP